MGPMDEIGLRYLLLGLRLGRHLPGMVSSYVGPPDLAEAVAGEDLTPPAELHAEAMKLADVVAELPATTGSQRRRSAWVVGQLGAMSAIARQVGGEEIGFVDLVEELYDIEVLLEPDSTFGTARHMLDGALPPGGSLRERLASHERSSRIAPEHAIAAVADLAAVLRDRTRRQLWLPESESVDLQSTHGEVWDSDVHYLGSGRSVVRINLDLPVTVGAVIEYAAHACYPGHHAEAAVKDAVLVRVGHPELGLIVDLSPQAVVSEGMATFAREVVMSDQELAVELGKLASSLGQPLDIEAELMVHRARRLMTPALGNAAVALHRDGEPPEQVRAYLAEAALVTDERLDGLMGYLGDPTWRTYPFTHIDGRRLVGEWLEANGQTHGYSRLLAEQMSPGHLRAELAEAR